MEREVQSVDTSTEETMNQSLPGMGSGALASTVMPPVAGVSLVKLILACLGAIVFPGLGHLVLGRWGRAVLLAVSIVSLFALGLFWMEGRLYQPDPNEVLSIFPFLANAGLGGIYGLCYLLKVGFEANAAAPTYEFGNTLLFGGGLLNYLIILDAFDIAAGRKN
jgi:hypothetical protein